MCVRTALGIAVAILSFTFVPRSASALWTIADMVEWASSVDALTRGPLDIASPGAGLASYGGVADVLGPAAGDQLTVLSLGDGGTITLAFANGIGDGPGDDFAVFENGFWSETGLFAELAFVEVSSNGVDFVRFDAFTSRATPVGGGGVVDPADYSNLAGDAESGSGTGFDLAELSGDALVVAGLVDLDYVEFVRLIDVVGDGSTMDAVGNPVYDPYPTAFPSGGFDLDGVGVIHVPEPVGLAPFAVACAQLLVLSRRRRSALSRRRCSIPSCRRR